MPLVTIRGQFGSGVDEIGKLVAARLNADYVDREIIASVAELLNRRAEDVIEKEMPPGSILERIVAAIGHMPTMSIDPGGVDRGVYLPTWEIPLNDTRYLEGLKSIIMELAMSESIVIQGRGSQFILKHWPRALHVLLVAPVKLRVRQVMGDMKMDEESAKKEIDRFDSSRREFIKRYFKAELEDPLHYDIVINTGDLSLESVTSIIVNALSLKERT